MFCGALGGRRGVTREGARRRKCRCKWSHRSRYFSWTVSRKKSCVDVARLQSGVLEGGEASLVECWRREQLLSFIGIQLGTKSLRTAPRRGCTMSHAKWALLPSTFSVFSKNERARIIPLESRGRFPSRCETESLKCGTLLPLVLSFVDKASDRRSGLKARILNNFWLVDLA